MSKRSGFTLVELLVVIAIIGLLVSILLPAVQSVREAARKTQCLNNLRQMGLAIHGYESSNMRIPSSRPADGFLTWPVFLMPWLEQQNLFDRLDVQARYIDQDPAALMQGSPLMICPSRRSGVMISNRETNDLPRGAVGDYAGNAGSHVNFLNLEWALFTDDVDGVFNSGFIRDNPIMNNRLIGTPQGRYEFGSVTDGLSNTVFIGEKHLDPNALGEPGGVGDGCIYNGDEPATFMRLGGVVLRIAPNSRIGISPGEAPVWGSMHPGAANFLLGDGSTQTYPVDTDEEVVFRLCSRNDGMVVDSAQP